MTKALRTNAVMGLTRLSKPRYASEPGFVDAVNRQMKTIRDDLEYIFEQFEDATPEIMLEAMRPTFEKSQRYVPKDTMALHDSGYLEIAKRGKNSRVEIGYAKGGNPRYAPYVHEMLSHKHAAPTRAKFLSSAVDEDLYEIIDRLADGYKRFMGA